MPLTDRDFMERALARARQARDTGEVPVGAVLVDAGGQILAEAGNAPIANHDPSAHAEMLVLRDAARKVRNYRLPGTTLYATLEPCPMCAGALVHARVERIVYAAADPRAGACGTVFDLARSDALNHRIEITSGVLEDEGSALLKSFFAEKR